VFSIVHVWIKLHTSSSLDKENLSLYLFLLIILINIENLPSMAGKSWKLSHEPPHAREDRNPSP